MSIRWRRRHSADEYLLGPGERPRKDRIRFPIFLAVFIIACGSGLAYTYDRPAVYESNASLLITPPAQATVNRERADARTVGIERHALLANAVLTDLLARLAGIEGERSGVPRDMTELRGMLSVRDVEQTNIVELRGRGPNPRTLPVVINSWADLYLASQVGSQQTSIKDTGARLDKMALDFKQRVAGKRAEIDRFRRRHDIVSMQREENRVLARLKGLTRSFNAAKDEELEAQSKISAIRRAIEQGKPVVSLQDQRRMANLETRAVALSEQIKAFEQRFTPKYRELDPDIKSVYRQFESIEQRIAALRQEARASMVSEAEQRFASASQSVLSLARELEQSKQTVADFTSRFAEHEALTEELGQIELAYREVKDRQVRREVDQRREVTRVAVLGRAFVPTSPVWPNYNRDAAISVGTSVLLGILAVLFYDFFNRPARPAVAEDSDRILQGIAGYSAITRAAYREVTEAPPAPELEYRPPRELDESEIRSLMDSADKATLPLAGLVLSGLTVDQVRGLRRADIDPEAGVIDVPDADGRTLLLPDTVKSAFARLLSDGGDAEALVWHDREGNAFAPEELDALISLAAHDSGLTDAGTISAETLRHTYIAFLVRQGARLSEIESIVGHLPPSTRAAYAAFSPAGPGVPSDRLVLIHPALRGP